MGMTQRDVMGKEVGGGFMFGNLLFYILKKKTKLEIELLYNAAIPLLGIYTEKTRIERDMCTPMFITALFIIARAWKQSRCPSADECISCSTYTQWNITQPLKRIHLNQF